MAARSHLGWAGSWAPRSAAQGAREYILGISAVSRARRSMLENATASVAGWVARKLAAHFAALPVLPTDCCA